MLDPRLYVFGYGRRCVRATIPPSLIGVIHVLGLCSIRRICPGARFAEESLFITIASMLQVFVIEPLVDASGAPVLPEETYKKQGLTW